MSHGSRARSLRLVPNRPPRQPNQKDLAVEIMEAEIRSAQYEVWLEAAKLVLIDAEPVEIARKLREMAERTIRPKPKQ